MSQATKDETFRGQPFSVAKGSLHPEYSSFTFDEERDIRETYWNVREGDVVLDVGASYGSYTLPACAVGATVVAFEPEPLVFTDFVQNLQLNGWLRTRCHPFNLGLWDEDAVKVSMATYAPHWPQHTISGPYQMVTLDRFALTHPELLGRRLDWLKVDVEGAEEQVLRGGIETIRRFRPKLLVECHVFLDSQLKDRVVSLLKSIHLDYIIRELDRPPCIMLVVT